MTVSVAASWSGSHAVPSGYVFPYPAARPVQIGVANVAGDWMIALITWRQVTAGAGVTVSVADDAHNYWEPLGAPIGDSAAAGVTRTAIWYAPAARAASLVQVAATGNTQAIAALILDVAGMSPWVTLAGITPGYANAATALSLSVGAPASQALMLAALGTDSNGWIITGPGAGWTSLTAVSATNGVDRTADIELNSAWQVATTAQTAAWTAGGTLDLSGVTAAILLTSPAPAQPNPDWPIVITELDPGAGVTTPPSQLSWTPISARSLAMTIQQGRQYTLGQLQAGQGTLTIDNPDGAVIPPGTGAFAGIDSGTPVRQRMIWTGGAWQVSWSGNGTTASPGIQTPFNAIPVTPLTQYAFPFQAYCPGGWPVSSGGLYAYVYWYTSGGTYISDSFTGPLALPAGQVIQGTLTGQAPAGAAYGQVSLFAGGTPASTAVFCASAAPPVPGNAALWVPGITWTATGSASLTTLAPWKEDPRGAPNVTPYYVPFSGFFQRWPFAFEQDLLRGKTDATILDAWAYAGGTLDSMAREECLLDNPYALWPLNDPAGSSSAANIAPGNADSLILVTSKLGAGGATEAFGANSSGLLGDSSAKVTTSGSAAGASGMWSQTLAGTSQNTNGYGYALVCQDTGYPPITGGVTIESWFQISNETLFGFTASTSGSQFGCSAGYATGTPVVLSVAAGYTLPGGFSAGLVYYVIGASGNNFQLSATPGGSAITVTANGAGFIQATTPWNPVVMAARNLKGSVVQICVGNTDGALLLEYTTASGVQTTVTIDTGTDYRSSGLMWHCSVAFSRTSWQVTALTHGVIASGTFSSPLPPAFTEVCVGGIQDRSYQGGAWTGYSAMTGVYPGMLATTRSVSHYWAALEGMRGEAACDRVERVLEYAGLTGRRWIGQQAIPGEGDLVVSGQDIGGQPAATSVNNIAASTVPAMMYVAPTGDISYLAKYHAWNNPVKWVLGDNTAAGEIPFTAASFATDYDPARVVNYIQLTQLDTSQVTVPSGATATTTMGAIETASQNQYGTVPYQQTGYLTDDSTSAYTAGGGLNDLATWLADVYRKPQNRVQAVVVDAAKHPSAWPFVAGVSVGDMVMVNVRPPTAATSPLISLTARVTQTSRSTKFALDGAAGSVSCVLDFAPEYNCLTCDDPVRGLLNGTNVLGW